MGGLRGPGPLGSVVSSGPLNCDMAEGESECGRESSGVKWRVGQGAKQDSSDRLADRVSRLSGDPLFFPATQGRASGLREESPLVHLHRAAHPLERGRLRHVRTACPSRKKGVETSDGGGAGIVVCSRVPRCGSIEYVGAVLAFAVLTSRNRANPQSRVTWVSEYVGCILQFLYFIPIALLVPLLGMPLLNMSSSRSQEGISTGRPRHPASEHQLLSSPLDFHHGCHAERHSLGLAELVQHTSSVIPRT